MSVLTLKNIAKSFGATEVIKGIDLRIDEGEFVVFVGPSGCGKSTLLRLISGLEQADAGEIILDSEIVNDHTPFERGIAMVFQSYALYPHMTVAENMGFPLKMVKEKPHAIAEKVNAAAKTLQIDQLLDRRPDQLSGGQKQRVAMGRTIVRDPTLFLFDEPLSNLDADLRIEMRVEIEKLHKRLKATMIYVTHDQVEAMTLADRIVVLRDGVIEQIGAPLDLYDNPVNKFVASFLGSPKINFLSARVVDVGEGAATLSLRNGARFVVPMPTGDVKKDDALTIGVRPEDFAISGGDFSIPFDLELQEQLGPVSYLHGSSNGEKIVAEHRVRGKILKETASTLGVNSARIHVFDTSGRSVRHGRKGQET
ncbi:MAG: sn-glycerol-3-phosphate ABC transporter ATP-binding protein UgpC [Alphaproteobacteria bacterium]|nr:sn-glycerol-3-phosphate ABC transporter ATP-binding protein UgpC [Alphaproteobacteria bacterium]